jgi:hypothetical protein
MDFQKKEEEPSDVKKRILAKNKVRNEIDEQRKKLRFLKEQLSEGKNVSRDIDGCEGYIQVLKKELISIQEGNHSTFLVAKKHISPKFNFDTKKSKILLKIRTLAKDIRDREAFLSGGGRTQEEIDKIRNELEVIKAEHADSKQELKALSQFNHTRFLEMKQNIPVITKEEQTPLMENIPVVSEEGKSKIPSIKPIPSVGNVDFDPPPMI